MNPVVLTLAVVLFFALLSVGYGYHRGTNVLAGAGSLVGLILVVLLVLFLLGQLHV